MPKIKTDEDFIEALEKRAKELEGQGEWKFYPGEKGGLIRFWRDGSAGLCPIEVLGGLETEGAFIDVASDLGMSRTLRSRIIEAADYSRQLPTRRKSGERKAMTLRRRILKVVGLTERKG